MSERNGILGKLSTARTVLGDLGSIIMANPGASVARARFMASKMPSLVQGLKLVGKKDKAETLSIGTLLERNAREFPESPALFFEDMRFTHRQLNDNANRYANLFAKRGVGKGDPVAIFVDNRPELLFAVAGAVKLGAIAALINTKQRKNVLTHSFDLCKAKAFVVGEELWPAFAEVRDTVSGADAEHVFFIPDEGDMDPPRDATDLAAELGSVSSHTPAALATVSLGDPCFYIYTSGTTGMPKASIMSHLRWIKAAGVFGKAALGLNHEDVIYTSLPLYHNNALTVTWSSAAVSGAAMALRRKFSASSFWDDTRRYGATAFCYIGELCRYLMNQPEKPDDADNPVRKIVGNGLRPDIWKEFKRRFGIEEVYEFYAASEGNVAFINVLNLDCTIGFCPAPYALVQYDIHADEPVRDERGHLIRVGRGEVGLLVSEVSERYAFDGYTDPKASEKKLFRDVFREGDVWFNSGDLLRDLGFRHAQFVDRVGDTFRWKSENVSTNEVAEVVNGFEGVAETTVYGVQIPGTEGRAGMASIVLHVPLEELDMGGLVRHLEDQLPVYAQPLFLRFQKELEVTGTFKQVKGDLKEQGFDRAKVQDPLYVMLPKTRTYVPLTDAVFSEIMSGQVAF